MTRKDFELIARVLNNSSEVMDEYSFKALVDNFVDELQGTNPNFNATRFAIAAKGLTGKVGA